jgi:hypothetical protein
MQRSLIDLIDRLHALHEPGKGLELCPLVVGGADRDFDLDAFVQDCHSVILLQTGVGAYGMVLMERSAYGTAEPHFQTSGAEGQKQETSKFA